MTQRNRSTNHWIVGLALVLAPSGRIAAQGQALLPELFGKGLISTELDELNAAFTPDGKELYYSISAPDGRMGVIMVSRLNGQQWSKPEVVPFSGRYTDYDPFVTVDGSKLFFISTRPSGEQPKAPGDFDVWVVERQGTSWGEPRNLGAPVNSERPEYYPSVARDGTLYFSTQREGSGGFDVFRSKLVDGKYTIPENLGPNINGPGSDIDNYIAPDQSFLVWAGYGRQGAPGGGDLFISWFKDGAWTPGQLLGHGINSVAREYCPIGTPDGKWFYWTSKRGFLDEPRTRSLTTAELSDSLRSVRNGQGNIYRIPIEALKN
jgi:hypothetical protein